MGIVFPQIQHNLNMLESKFGLLGPSKQTRRLQHVLNLPAVQVYLSQLIKLCTRKFFGVVCPLNKLSPNKAPGGRIKILVGKRHVNTRLECRIDVLSSVGSQEQDTLYAKLVTAPYKKG